MTSIDDTDHGKQEDDEDEWETVWVPADYLQQEAMRQQQRFSDPHTRALEDLNRMQDQIDPPSLRALRRMDQIAAGSMPTWMENQRRTEEMLYRAQGLVPQRRRKQRAHSPIVRQLPERPSTPLQREDAPLVTSVQTKTEPPKRKRGRQEGDTYNTQDEYEQTLQTLAVHSRKGPSQVQVAEALPVAVNVEAVRTYARRWHGSWNGSLRFCSDVRRGGTATP